ncbi:hypothetical protein [Pseudomonas sp. NPDC089734]|uniref:hypothetical protein n=1 Tax=Pseudomonas sp. NPDC089734 TaxID=3364469 RepID=UPI0038259951
MNSRNINAAYLGNMDSMVAFSPGMTTQERTDIQNILLYAQLFASQQYDFLEQWSSWMHYYRNRLEKLGLRSAGKVTQDSLLLTSIEDLEQATFGVMGEPDSSQLVSLVRRSFDALGVYQKAEAFFQGDFNQKRLTGFQIVPCEKTCSNEIRLLLCSLHLNTDSHSSGDGRLIFYFKGGSYVFAPAAYEAHRESVVRYLSGKALATIRSARI